MTLNEPQTWTIIGVMAAGLFALLGVMTTKFTRVIRTEIGGVRTEISSVRTEIDSVRMVMNTRFDAVDRRFDSVDKRMDHLDQDVQYLMKREMER